jgi:uncharacterized protein (TIGR03435 family)
MKRRCFSMVNLAFAIQAGRRCGNRRKGFFMRGNGLMVGLLLMFAALAAAQDVPPAFDVVSLRQNNSGDRARSFRIEPGGTLQATNVTVRHLMWNAYGVQDFQIVGGPSWIGTARYDVVAKAEGNPGRAQLRAMLRTFLEQRFKLRTTSTRRELPIYALVVTPEAATRLRPAEGACAGSAGPESGCGAMMGASTLKSPGLSMPRLAGELTGVLGVRVEDRTGLSGNFDIELEWAPDTTTDAAAADGRASIFTAVQEQLGLRLNAARGPVDVVVVEAVERPALE